MSIVNNEMIWSAPLSFRTTTTDFNKISIISNDDNLQYFVTRNAAFTDLNTSKIGTDQLVKMQEYTDGYALSVVN